MLFGFQAYRWNSNLVADLQLVIVLAALLVNPHFALSDDSINKVARHSAKLFKQEIIEPLVELCSSYFDQAYGCFLWFY